MLACLEGRTYSTREIAEMLGKNHATITRWIKQGSGGRRLRAYRIGTKFVVRESDLEDFLLYEPDDDGGVSQTDDEPDSLESRVERGMAACRALGLKV